MQFELTMPALSPTMEEGTIVEWRKQVGDEIKEGDVICLIQTDKATLEYEALDPGFLREILVTVGSMAKVNQPIAVFTDAKDTPLKEVLRQSGRSEKEKERNTESRQSAEEKPAVPSSTSHAFSQPSFVPEPPLEHYRFVRMKRTEFKASPLAKKLAKEKSLDLSSVKGSGPGGRVVSEDLALAQKQGPFSSCEEVPDRRPGSYEEIAMTPMRSVIAKRLQEAKTFIPHYYITEEIRCDRLIDLRSQLREFSIHVTFNDFVVRAVALALREHPEINAGFNSKTHSIIRYQTIDIALAVDIPDGLITPIIRHADYKNLQELSYEAKALAKKARENRLALEEFKGGSFTISNLGMFGIKGFIAVINPPQCAILAVGGIKQQPVANDGVLSVGHIMEVTLSADHRAIDGANAAKFLVTFKKYMEQPASLLL